MRIIAILMILTLSSCMVSQKTFDAKIDDMQNQINSTVPRVEFEMKEQSLRKSIENLWNEVDKLKTKNDTLRK